MLQVLDRGDPHHLESSLSLEHQSCLVLCCFQSISPNCSDLTDRQLTSESPYFIVVFASVLLKTKQ